MSAGTPILPATTATAAALLAAALLLAGRPALAQDTTSPAEARRWRVVEDASHLVVVVDRAGLLSFLGHRHAIVPQEWRAEMCLAGTRPPTGHGRIVISTAALVIDSDSARSLAGLGEGPGAEDRREIQEKMLSERFLAASSDPEIVIGTTEVRPAEEGRLEARADVTVRGTTRSVSFPVQYEEGAGGRIRLRGSVGIRQTAFGIEPESIGGVVEVRDEVELRFDLLLEPTEEGCSDPPARRRPAGTSPTSPHAPEPPEE